MHLESTYGSRTKDRSKQAEETPRKNDGIEGDETEDLDALLHQVKVRSLSIIIQPRPDTFM